MKKRPLSEGSTRGQVKGGVNKPSKGGGSPATRPNRPPPPPAKSKK